MGFQVHYPTTARRKCAGDEGSSSRLICRFWGLALQLPPVYPINQSDSVIIHLAGGFLLEAMNVTLYDFLLIVCVCVVSMWTATVIVAFKMAGTQNFEGRS